MGSTARIDGSAVPTSSPASTLSSEAVARGRRFLADRALSEQQVFTEVTAIQRQLQAGGFYSARLDGDFGNMSARGMRAFLRAFPMPAGSDQSRDAQIAWLRSVAANRFRTPDTVVRQTITTVPATGTPRALTAPAVSRLQTTSRPADVLRDMPLSTRGERNERTLLHQLNFTIRNAFDDAYDHTSGHTVTIPAENVARYAAMAAEVERRLPGLALWAGPSRTPDQPAVAAVVARTYAQISRWHATHGDPELARQFAQKAVDLIAVYGRIPSNTPVVSPGFGTTTAYVSRGGDPAFTGALARLPLNILSECTFSTASGQVRLGSLGNDIAGILDAVSEDLHAHQGAERPLPTASQIRAALYPQQVATGEVRRVRDALVSLHLCNHALERNPDERGAQAMFGKPYAALTNEQQRQMLNATAHTRNLLLTRIEHLEELEQKVSTGAVLTTEERRDLDWLMRQAADITTHLQRRRPDLGYTADLMQRIAAEDLT